MAYRTPAYACSACHETAFSTCSRCEAARCVEHTITHGPRCPDCEHAFHQHVDAVRGWVWRLLGVCIALPLLPFMTGPMQAVWRRRMWAWGALPTGLAAFDAVVITVFVAWGMGHGLVSLRQWQEARRFDMR